MPIVYHKFTQKSSYFRGKSSRSINMSIINGLHGFNLGVIFLILTYFVSEVLLQKYNTCQPLPRSIVIHRFCTGCPRLWITLVYLWITLGSVDSLWITLGATLAWFVHGLTSVRTCVGAYSWHSYCYAILLYHAHTRLTWNDTSGQ